MFSSTFTRIVLTAGISLFGPNNIYGKWMKKSGIFAFDITNPIPIAGDSKETALDKWKIACQAIDTKAALQEPKRVSVEYSLPHALQENHRLGNSPHITLIHTDTLGGIAAAFLLKKVLFDNFNATVVLKEVADINVQDREKLRKSLGGFMETVAAVLSAGEPGTTCFAPVGGFKVMTSLGYVAGAYMKFPTMYLHEDNQTLHEIPAVPVRISEEELENVAPLLKRLKNIGDIEIGELGDEDKKMFERFPYLFEQIENLVGLNAFASFLMDRPENQRIFGQTIFFSPEASKKLGDNKLSDHLRGEIQELLRKLKFPEKNRNILRHDAPFQNLKNSSFFLYKPSGQGELVFRAAYLYDSASESLYLNRIWTDHDLYERHANQGTGFFDNPDSIKWENRNAWFYS